MNLDDVHNYAHTRLLVARNMYTLVTGEKFDAAFQKCDAEERSHFEKMIKANDHDGIAIKVGLVLKETGLEMCSIRELRAMARKYRIRSYAIMPKAMLLSAIRTLEDKRRAEQQQPKSIAKTARGDAVSPEPGEGVEARPRAPGVLGDCQ